MNYRVILLSRAMNDVQVIFDWIDERSSKGARSWYDAFQAAWKSLESNPERHAVANESRDVGQEFRELLFRTAHGKRYRLLFKIAGAEVIIYRVRGPGEPLVHREDLN